MHDGAGERIGLRRAEPTKRLGQLQLVSRFMAWKSALAFTQAIELEQPAAVACIGCSHSETVGFLSLIERGPLRFSEPIELSAGEIGEEVPALLPRGVIALTEADIAELKQYFGADGFFPAVHIPSGRIGAD